MQIRKFSGLNAFLRRSYPCVIYYATFDLLWLMSNVMIVTACKRWMYRVTDLNMVCVAFFYVQSVNPTKADEFTLKKNVLYTFASSS